MSRVIRTAGIRRGGGLSIACSLLHVRPSLTDAELDWALPHGELYGFPSRAGVFAAFSMPGENRFRIFGAVPPRPEGPSGKYSEPTHEEFQALLDERLPLPAKVVKEYWVTAACLAPLGHCPLTRGSFPQPSETSNVGGR
jgi:hypothetical protein